MAEGEGHHEIVIIHRGGHGDHDEHHGGVWKIAFADFMTAMMAFFLVMWLVSANDKTKASVVKYFNPVHLVDATTSPPGLNDKQDASAKEAKEANKGEPNKGASEKSAASPTETGKESAAQKEKRLDSAMRENPIAALTEIAAAKGQGNGLGGKTVPSTAVIGRKGGEAFRDPFAPLTVPSANVKSADDDAVEALAKLVTEPDALPPPSPPPVASAGKDTTSKDIADKTGAADKIEKVEKPAKSDKAEKSDQAEKPVPSAKPETPAVAQADTRRDAEAKSLLSALQGDAKGEPGPKVDVRRTPEGLVLSLTDTADFSMFSNGSSVPAREVVLMMDRVAGVLKSKQGSVIIRGFTDNKPYRGTHYDNWHLSLDRAQVAHYMLVHGGLDDARIGHVEGYADRNVKPGVDASSPLNRRIEILLKDAG